MPARTLLNMGEGEARSSESAEQGWVDLARNPPGIGITHEAARRRQAEGAGADRSWRVGAEGEFAVADLLATLTEPSRWQRWRGRSTGWFVLHSVPLGDGHGRVRGDVDHLVIGPPGLVSINTKHHRTGKLYLDGDELVLNGHPTAYVPKARREAQRVTGFLQQTLDRRAARAGREGAGAAAAGHRRRTAHDRRLAVRRHCGDGVEADRGATGVPRGTERRGGGRGVRTGRRSTTWNPAAPYLSTPEGAGCRTTWVAPHARPWWSSGRHLRRGGRLVAVPLLLGMAFWLVRAPLIAARAGSRTCCSGIAAVSTSGHRRRPPVPDPRVSAARGPWTTGGVGDVRCCLAYPGWIAADAAASARALIPRARCSALLFAACCAAPRSLWSRTRARPARRLWSSGPAVRPRRGAQVDCGGPGSGAFVGAA